MDVMETCAIYIKQNIEKYAQVHSQRRIDYTKGDDKL